MHYQSAFSIVFCAFLGAAAVLAADVPPVHLRIRLAGAREAPPTIDDLLFMVARPVRREWAFDVAEVGTVTNGYKGVSWFEPSWKRPIYLFEYSGLINVPAGADYTFYVRKPTFGPAYLLINGEPMVDFPNRGGDFFRRNGGRQWRRGRWGRQNGFRRQEEERRQDPPPSSDSKWIEGETIHLEKGMAEFRALGFCERRADFEIAWKTSSQSEPQPISANLFARAEKLRFTDLGRPLVYRAADARLAGVPPFCFAEDAVRPELHVRSNVANVEVAITLRLRPDAAARNDGATVLSTTSTVALVKGWGRVELPEWRAADCERIDWLVRDGKDELARGTAKFIAPPFDEMPDGVYGDALTQGGTNCIFMARRYGRMTAPYAPQRAQGEGAVFVDGFGGAASNLLSVALDRALEGNAPPLERTVDVRELVTADEALFAPLDLVSVLNLLHEVRSGTVVLAPEIRGIAVGEDLGGFERRLAAVAGFLTEVRGCELVLVTPPPEMSGGAAEVRDYAAVIHRVADAYGLRVADVYTLSRTGGHVRKTRKSTQ